MNKAEAKKKIVQLSKQIEEHNYHYYVLDQPVISDKEFDCLLKELIDLEAQHPELKSANSPTQRVGIKISSGIKTLAHKAKMYSLDNTYSIEELKEWDRRVHKGLPGQAVEYVVELKIDGVSAALTYEQGQFTVGATRGDGVTGEDVTHSLKTIRSIPLRLRGADQNNFPFLLEVRAEIYMNREDFLKLNEQRKKSGEDVFANPRNATSGSVKLLDSRITAQRNLSCFVHSLGKLEGGKAFKTQWEFLNFVNQAGFCVDQNHRLCSSIDGVITYCMEFQEKRESIPYEVDGVVIKVNSLQQQNQLGHTLKSPRWAVAYKFPAHQVTSTIKDIVIQVGRTGVLTPVAEVEPVECGGVTISRSTLHNFDEIKRLDVQKGDRVLIERAGDVIPKIIKVVAKSKSGRAKAFNVPLKCPACGGRIVKEKEQQVAYRCINPQCVRQLERRLLHFASRGAMDIEGMGESVAVQLVSKNIVKDVADIYFLHKDQLLSLELFKDKKADNLLAAIKNSKGRSLSRFLFGLGLPNIGEKAAFTLARKYTHIDRLFGITQEELESVHEIGNVMAKSLLDFFQSKQGKQLIAKFKKAGLSMAERIEPTNQALEGKKFVFTGELSTMTRSQANTLVKNLGGDVNSSVSKNTDYVVAGDSPGSKYTKAVNLGIKVLTEKQFSALIDKNKG